MEGIEGIGFRYNSLYQETQREGDNAFYRWFMVALRMSVFYYTIDTPIEFAFYIKPPIVLIISSSVASMVILLNTVDSIIIHYRSQGIWNRRSLLLACDVLSVLPFGVIADKAKVDALILFIWLRLLHLRKIVKWQELFDNYLKEKGHVKWLLTVRFLKVIAVDLYWLHVSASILYFTAAFPNDPTSTWMGNIPNFKLLPFFTRYTNSVYFAYVTLSTVGYGDIHPTTKLEVWVVKVLLLLTAILALISAHMGNNLLKKFLEIRRQLQAHNDQQDTDQSQAHNDQQDTDLQVLGTRV